MRSSISFAVALAVFAAAPSVSGAADPAAAPADPLAPLAWLAGSCWNGDFGDGKTRDFACYERILGGHFLRGRHRVTGGPKAYAGETIFGPAGEGKGLAFSYFNSDGETIRGAIVPGVDELQYPEESAEIGGKPVRLRSVWRHPTPDRYLAVTEKFEDGAWHTMMTIDFRRGGPSSEWKESE